MYAAAYYYGELSVAAMLCRLNLSLETSDAEVQTRLARLAGQSEIELDEHQQEAVAEAMKNGLLILTGGPGTERLRRSTRLSGALNRKI